eukprot:3664081-Pleurochrysis_carterae.AAC.2
MPRAAAAERPRYDRVLAFALPSRTPCVHLVLETGRRAVGGALPLNQAGLSSPTHFCQFYSSLPKFSPRFSIDPCEKMRVCETCKEQDRIR